MMTIMDRDPPKGNHELLLMFQGCLQGVRRESAITYKVKHFRQVSTFTPKL
jgi:hypothetical protein